MTGRAKINFGGARKVYLCEFERGMGAREIYPSLDQMNKVKIKNSFKRFFRPKAGDLQKKKKKVFTGILKDFPAEITNSIIFPAENG